VKKNRWRIACLLLVLAGAAVLAGGLVCDINGAENLLSRYGVGIGSSWLTAGAFFLIRGRIDPKWAREQEILPRDERSVQVRGRAGNFTFYFTAFMLLALQFVFLESGDPLAWVVSAAILAHVACWLIALFIYGKKL